MDQLCVQRNAKVNQMLKVHFDYFTDIQQRTDIHCFCPSGDYKLKCTHTLDASNWKNDTEYTD